MPDLKTNGLSHLGFRTHFPSRLLQRYIKSYWFINAVSPAEVVYNEFLHPDGGMGLIYNYGNPLIFGKKPILEDSFLDGTNTRSVSVKFGGNIQAIGIRFNPGGAYSFMQLPVYELKNFGYSCSEIQLRLFSDLHGQLEELSTDTEKAKLLDLTLLKLLKASNQIVSPISQSITIMRESKGMLQISKLANNLGISQRTLERDFRTQIGMSPTEFSKAIRIEHARAYLKHETLTYSDISHNLGYFDQAHFNKQFKSLVGITPGEYRCRARQKNK